MNTEITKPDFVAHITSDDVLGDLSKISQAVAVADKIEKMGVTAKLYLIAETVSRHGMEAALQVLSSQFGHSDAYCGMLIKLVLSVGLDMLKDALLNSSPLTIDQWREISAAKLADKERVYKLAVEHGAPALEMRADINGLSVEEQRKLDIISRLESILRQVEKFNLRDRAVEVLTNYGYLKKVIMSQGVKK